MPLSFASGGGGGGASFSDSAGLAALLSDETGSAGGGLAVFNKSPVLVTPNIDFATGKGFSLDSGAITASTPNVLKQTWNASAQFIGFDIDITDTSSLSTSLLARARVGGVNRMELYKTGEIRAYLNSTDYTQISPRSNINSQLNSLGRSATLVWDDGSNNGNGQGLIIGANGGIRFSSTNRTDAGTIDVLFQREAAGILGLRGGVGSGVFPVNSTVGCGLSMYTFGASPPAAPAAGMGRIYMDTSGGKIRFMAVFPSGAAQQIAIEP